MLVPVKWLLGKHCRPIKGQEPPYLICYFFNVTQGNAFTEMFDRLKAENEQRKMEVHGLKDILVRENDHRIRDTEELRMAMELSSQKLGEALERECIEMDQV